MGQTVEERGTVSRSGLVEFTIGALVCGLFFGVLFGAANAYLGLKAGLTVSTSIPIAVLTVAIFRAFSAVFGLQGSLLLRANMAQTIGSASSSLASGTIFTIPALFLWGITPPLHQVAILAFCGGLLGILAMVPLRRLLIVQADAELPYPEGRACADVLRATERGSTGGQWIFIGLGLGALLKLLVTQFHLLPETIAWPLGSNASLALSLSPALLAVGFIIGYRAASVMVVGGFLTSLVLYPLVTKAHHAGAGDAAALLTAKEVKDRFLIYVGAGAVAAAGLLTIVRTGPTMMRSLAAVVSGLRRGSGTAVPERTDRDVPGIVLVIGIGVVVTLLAFAPRVLAGELSVGQRLCAALGATLFAFLFVPVSSRLVGVIGVSSNPTSAMALITLAGTAGVFLLLGWSGTDARAAVLTVGTVVCVAASKAGDISQDLKTGQLVGATPAKQQFGQLIAAAVACWAVAGVVIAIGHLEGYGEGGMPAPQARLMKTVVEAVLGEALPWDMMAMGGALSVSAAIVGLPPLSFALGIYLPLATLATIFVGGLVRRAVERSEGSAETGILCASGFVAGEGLAGVLIVGYAFWKKLGRYAGEEPSQVETWIACAVLIAVAFVLYRSTKRAAA